MQGAGPRRRLRGALPRRPHLGLTISIGIISNSITIIINTIIINIINIINITIIIIIIIVIIDSNRSGTSAASTAPGTAWTPARPSLFIIYIYIYMYIT